MVRLLGILIGVAVHGLFALMVYHLYFFLGARPRNPARQHSVSERGLLALQFVVIHSLLLLPKVRTKLERVIPPAFYGLFFCLMTTLTLLLAMHYWQVGSSAMWNSMAGRER